MIARLQAAQRISARRGDLSPRDRYSITSTSRDAPLNNLEY